MVDLEAHSSCDFGKYLKEPCHKTHFTTKIGLKDFNDYDDDLKEIYLWRAGTLSLENELRQSFAAAVGVQKEKIMEAEAPHLSRIVMTKANDFDKLMEQIRDKLSTASSSEKVQLLTLTPESWSIKETAGYLSLPRKKEGQRASQQNN
eukprot:gene17220-8772_t